MLQNKGFTLVEILVVISLVSIISFFVVPYSIRQIAENRAYEAAATVSSVIFQSQQNSYAKKDGSAYGVIIEPNSYQTFTGVEETSATNLMAYWKMNEFSWEGVPGEVLDSSGSDISGTTHGGMITTSDGFARSAAFPQTDSYINMGDNDILDFGLNQNFTISAWVKTNINPVTDFYPWVLSKQGGASRTGYGIMANAAQFSPNWRATLWVGNTEYVCASNVDITNNDWHHLVVVREGSTLRVYTDSALSNTCSLTSASIENSYDFTIGTYSDLSVNSLDGNIDEVRIYNTNLSTTDINNLYNYNSRTITTIEQTNLENVETTLVSTENIILFSESGFRPFRPVSFNMNYSGSTVFVEVNSEGLINYYIDN
jgi:prepilin-type N-terminal cleavage/methylation domain-containing protein